MFNLSRRMAHLFRECPTRRPSRWAAELHFNRDRLCSFGPKSVRLRDQRRNCDRYSVHGLVSGCHATPPSSARRNLRGLRLPPRPSAVKRRGKTGPKSPTSGQASPRWRFLSATCPPALEGLDWRVRCPRRQRFGALQPRVLSDIIISHSAA